MTAASLEMSDEPHIFRYAQQLVLYLSAYNVLIFNGCLADKYKKSC